MIIFGIIDLFIQIFLKFYINLAKILFINSMILIYKINVLD